MGMFDEMFGSMKFLPRDQWAKDMVLWSRAGMPCEPIGPYNVTECGKVWAPPERPAFMVKVYAALERKRHESS